MYLKDAQLIINPAAGRWHGKKLAPKIQSLLKEQGLTTLPSFSNGQGNITKLVKQAILKGQKIIIVAGGDGSIHEAVNGIMQSGKSDISLGIIPLGTGNDFIKAAGIPKNLNAACEYLSKASPKKIDLGRITTSQTQANYFINNIGAGFDGKVGLTAAKIPFLRGIAVYIIALIWHLIKGIPNPFAQVTIDGKNHAAAMTLIAISNGTTYGGTFNIAPNAKLNDGKLDCVFVPARRRFNIIPMLFQLIQAKHLNNPKVLFKQCENFSVETDEPIVVIADGELISENSLGFKVEVIKNQFQLLVCE